MTQSSAFVGKPVWYYREEEQSWWPALRFPNVWTAYAVCHDLHLTTTTMDNDNATTTTTATTRREDLFYEWTAFCLQQTLLGNQEEAVLCRLADAPEVHFDLVKRNVEGSLKSLPPLNRVHCRRLQQATEHLKLFLASPQMRGPKVEGIVLANDHDYNHEEEDDDVVLSTTTTTTNTTSSTPTSMTTTPTVTATNSTTTRAPSAVTPAAKASSNMVSKPTKATTGSSSSRSDTTTNQPKNTTSAISQSQENVSSTCSNPTSSSSSSSSSIHDNGESNSNTRPPPIDGQPIQPHDAWPRVWAKLEFSGFTQRPGGVYVKPAGRVEVASDVFATRHALQAYCRTAYGWQGSSSVDPNDNDQHSDLGDDDEEEEEEEEDDDEESDAPLHNDDDYDDDDDDEEEEEFVEDNSTIRTESVMTKPRRVSAYQSPAVSAITGVTTMTTTPVNQPTQPQDPAKPLPPPSSASSVESTSSQISHDDSVDSNSTEAANRYWKRTMKKQGWKNIKGHSGDDWHWVRPGASNTRRYVKGQDYFDRLVDAYLYATNRQPRPRGRGIRRKATKAAIASHPQPKQKISTKSSRRSAVSPVAASVNTKTSSLMRKFEQANKKKKEPLSGGRRHCKQSASTTITDNPPKWSRVRGILSAHCGFVLADRRQVEYQGKRMDEMTTGLVLLQQGIPALKKLQNADKQQHVVEWLRHLLVVPCNHKDGTADFDLKVYLRSDGQKLKTDANTLGFSFGLERIFLPRAPSTSVSLVYQTHYFYDHELDTLFANYLRCNFATLVPDQPTNAQRLALARLGQWLATIDHLELPPFQGIPKKGDFEFWSRVEHAAETLLGPHKKKKHTSKEPSPKQESIAASSIARQIEGDQSVASKASTQSIEAPFWNDEQIIQVLEKFGYKQTKTGSFRHDEMDKAWDSVDRLRAFMGRNGVYRFSETKETLPKLELLALFLWIFASLLKPEDYESRKEAPELTDKQIHALLCKGGWTTVSGVYFHPDAYGNRVPGIDKFDNLDEALREILLNLNSLRETKLLSEEEILQLRQWALRNPSRLIKDYKPRKRHRTHLDLDSVMLKDPPKRKKRKVRNESLDNDVVMLHDDKNEPTEGEPYKADKQTEQPHLSPVDMETKKSTEENKVIVESDDSDAEEDTEKFKDAMEMQPVQGNTGDNVFHDGAGVSTKDDHMGEKVSQEVNPIESPLETQGTGALLENYPADAGKQIAKETVHVTGDNESTNTKKLESVNACQVQSDSELTTVPDEQIENTFDLKGSPEPENQDGDSREDSDSIISQKEVTTVGETSMETSFQDTTPFAVGKDEDKAEEEIVQVSSHETDSPTSDRVVDAVSRQKGRGTPPIAPQCGLQALFSPEKPVKAESKTCNTERGDFGSATNEPETPLSAEPLLTQFDIDTEHRHTQFEQEDYDRESDGDDDGFSNMFELKAVSKANQRSSALLTGEDSEEDYSEPEESGTPESNDSKPLLTQEGSENEGWSRSVSDEDIEELLDEGTDENNDHALVPLATRNSKRHEGYCTIL